MDIIIDNKIHEFRRALSQLLRFRVPHQQLERSRPIRTPYSPDGARGTRTPHARGARRVTRASMCHECTPAVARRRECRRVDAEPAKRRVSAFRHVGGKRNGGISRGAMHGQRQKRRRRDARAATVTYTRTLTHQSLKRRVN